jgi:predicted nucleotidyltransferase
VDQPSEQRARVAKEAARLLYTGASEEYKHAKEQAARGFGLTSMPSNYEVAIELDLIAEEYEGEERERLLNAMREIAIVIMKDLVDYNPVLTGSVWRGTARRGSDIDINVYSSEPEDVESLLVKKGYNLRESEEVKLVKGGRTIRSRHISIQLAEGPVAEVVVRPVEEMREEARCETYGDLKRGLKLPELEKLMRTDSLRKFVPRRRYR